VEPSLPELLVHAEKVNLGHVHVLVVHAHMHGHRGDHAHQRAGLGAAHAHMPFLEVAWRSQRPLQEGDGVVKSARKSCVRRSSPRRRRHKESEQKKKHWQIRKETNETRKSKRTT
jgi:hypothetical protein